MVFSFFSAVLSGKCWQVLTHHKSWQVPSHLWELTGDSSNSHCEAQSSAYLHFPHGRNGQNQNPVGSRYSVWFGPFCVGRDNFNKHSYLGGGGKSVTKRTLTVISKFYQVTLIHFHLQRNLDQVHTASAASHPAANSLCKLPNTAEKVNKMLAKSNNNGIKAQQHGLQQCSSSILGRLHWRGGAIRQV